MYMSMYTIHVNIMYTHSTYKNTQIYTYSHRNLTFNQWIGRLLNSAVFPIKFGADG